MRGRGMNYQFAIIDDNGICTVVLAETRTEAIEAYCREKGCPQDYVKSHCIVRKYKGKEDKG